MWEILRCGGRGSHEYLFTAEAHRGARRVTSDKVLGGIVDVIMKTYLAIL